MVDVVSTLEEIAEKLARRQISPEHAESLAKNPTVLASLSPEDVHTLSARAFHLTVSGHWREAVRLHRLTLAATGSLPPDTAGPLQQEAALTLVRIASMALSEVPDGRLFRFALEAGEKIAAQAEQEKNGALLGEVLHNLGVLHLDPYTANRTNISYEQQILLWKQRLRSELGDAYFRYSEEELRMPEPAEALATAEGHFRTAVRLREGHRKGLTLKALTQTLEWRQELGASVTEEEIAGLCQEAIELLDPRRDPQIFAGALAMLARHRDSSQEGEDPLSQISLAEYAESMGLKPALEVAVQIASALASQDPPRSLALLRQVVTWTLPTGDENLLRQELDFATHLLPRALGRFAALQEAGRGVREASQRLQEQAAREGWSREELAATWIGLALRATQWDEEAEALELLDEAGRLAPELAEQDAVFWIYFRGMLQIGVASNAFKVNDFRTAVKAYGMALPDFLTLGLVTHALDLVERVRDLVERDPGAAQSGAVFLAMVALPCETKIGAAATQPLQRLGKRCMEGLLAEGSAKGEVLWLLLQALKGLPLSALLSRRPVQYDVASDESAGEILRRIAELPERPDAEPRADSHLDEELLLSAYLRSGESWSGDVPEEEAANLRHVFDEQVMHQLLGEIGEADAWHLGLEEVQARLDERTVLINYYFGSYRGSLALYILLVTRDELQLSIGNANFPDSSVMLEEQDLEVSLSPMSLVVKDVREQIQSDPGPYGTVLPEAAAQLAAAEKDYLGPSLEVLRRLRESGKDHLCIVPHGPFHFYPFHLVGERPLAEDWIVTYLPSLQLLSSSSAPAAAGRDAWMPVRVFGLEFEDHGFLDPLHGAVEECEAVAASFGVRPVLDRAATKKAFLDALPDSRCMHLATHGSQSAAPSFQKLYLAGEDDASDGVLQAYEILSLDLTGLRLLTLSACETALGRFDYGGNLRGLPASFFLAGVSALVGTLWEVGDAVSLHFFRDFYGELAEGKSLLDGFGNAQRRTREEFPEYRDWGAFYLMGDWRA